ncbi:hypothetical protein B0T22DRAFT_55749 [Podospora appendiculata]|uniref:F-box domain-containing protein n=1 Tax=Podospora appendiculata TaxID=314037 RepID=A0AAE0XI64_9PEZI|nr:hypothetical protein B0T22DRAFT_55749 [Podospora appendiculata]
MATVLAPDPDFPPAQVHDDSHSHSCCIPTPEEDFISGDHPLDPADFERCCPLDNGRHQYDYQPGQTAHSAGQLDRLPLELAQTILLQLDIPTLTRFRRVNRWAACLVDSLHPYSQVLKHCPGVLRAIIGLKASYFSLAMLYQTLSSTAQCASCDCTGGYLYLITCRRVCHHCFTTRPEYLPVALSLVTYHTELTPHETASLPSIITLPRPQIMRRTIPHGTIFIDRQALLDRVGERDITAWPLWIGRSLAKRATLRYSVVMAVPYIHPSGQAADWDADCERCVDRRNPRLGRQDVAPVFRPNGTLGLLF